ncbi:hypothetical protein T01_10119 [Trichinella spiralis]|uniref:Uncharacterized protein n=1 Tax=Trichinella spiralis TaxID=6334 RepID=A0A0V0YQ32_TRISP|nr:hypothetical protein T01_10119 [Trichinella spiralis]
MVETLESRISYWWVRIMFPEEIGNWEKSYSCIPVRTG